MRIVIDLFPAQLRVIPAGVQLDPENMTVYSQYEGSRLVTAVRVLVTEDTVLVAADSSDGPMLIFREKFDLTTNITIDRTGRTVSILMTESGKTLIFDKDNNCGCGSRLRSWNPYRTMGSDNDPIA